MIPQIRRLAGQLRGAWALRFKDRLTIDLDGVELRFDSEHPIARRWFYPRYAGGALHEPSISRLLRDRLEPDSVFFDVGSNLGYFAVLGVNSCNGPKGEVHAFEMDPSLIHLIRRSLELHPGPGRSFVTCAAISNRNGESLGYSPIQHDNCSTNRIHSRESETNAGENLAVSLTLDRYCELRGVRPDVIKIDIEGAELLALGGMTEILREIRPTLVVEVHPGAIEALGGETDDVLKLLRAANYELQVVGDYRSEAQPNLSRCPDSAPRDRPTMLLAIPVEKVR